MTPEEMLAYCLAKPGAWPDNPWGHEHPVVKVHDKIFAFIGGDGVGVKSGPTREVADEWLDRYPDDVSVMRYIGRSGWNDLRANGAIDDEDLLEAVDESYRLVVGKLAEEAPPGGLGHLTWERVHRDGLSNSSGSVKVCESMSDSGSRDRLLSQVARMLECPTSFRPNC